MADIIVEYYDDIQAMTLFTNGSDITIHESPILALGKDYLAGSLVCFAIKTCKSEDNHLSIREDINKIMGSLERLHAAGLTVEMNVLFDTSTAVDAELIENLSKVYECMLRIDGHIKLSFLNKVGGDNAEFNKNEISNILILVTALAAKYGDVISVGRICQQGSLYSGDLLSLIDAVPTLHIADNILTGVTASAKGELNSQEDVRKLLREYPHNILPRFDLCENICTKSNCYDTIKCGKCPILLSDRCLTCPLFGSCSGFFYNGYRTSPQSAKACNEEIFDACITFAATIASCASEDSLDTCKLLDKILDKNFIEHFNWIAQCQPNT
jgi:hypothetical protein